MAGVHAEADRGHCLQAKVQTAVCLLGPRTSGILAMPPENSSAAFPVPVDRCPGSWLLGARQAQARFPLSVHVAWGCVTEPVQQCGVRSLALPPWLSHPVRLACPQALLPSAGPCGQYRLARALGVQAPASAGAPTGPGSHPPVAEPVSSLHSGDSNRLCLRCPPGG